MPRGIYKHKIGYKILDTSKMNKDKLGKKRYISRWKRPILF